MYIFPPPPRFKTLSQAVNNHQNKTVLSFKGKTEAIRLLETLTEDAFEKTASKNAPEEENAIIQKYLRKAEENPRAALESLRNKPVKKGQKTRAGRLFNVHTTYFFRNDINWMEFGKYLANRFEDRNKVSTYIYACSYGKEPYSMSMVLQNTFGENSEKFFPINAKDIDDDVIECDNILKNAGIMQSADSISKMADLIGIEENAFKEKFLIPDATEEAGKHNDTIRLKESILKPVEFSCANILEDIENIDNENPSIIMMRNMWPYVDLKDFKDFADNLYNRLQEGSIVVLGSYDYSYAEFGDDTVNITKMLIKAGFEPSKKCANGDSPLIFEKN